jgi:hypothetical protein
MIVCSTMLRIELMVIFSYVPSTMVFGAANDSGDDSDDVLFNGKSSKCLEEHSVDDRFRNG